MSNLSFWYLIILHTILLIFTPYSIISSWNVWSLIKKKKKKLKVHKIKITNLNQKKKI